MNYKISFSQPNSVNKNLFAQIKRAFIPKKDERLVVPPLFPAMQQAHFLNGLTRLYLLNFNKEAPKLPSSVFIWKTFQPVNLPLLILAHFTPLHLCLININF